MILLHADMTHETITLQATATTRAGRDVVLVNGAAYVVHEPHETALRLVAQTFDVGHQ